MFFISFVIILKDPHVRLSTRNSLGNSFQSFAPVNLKVDWPIMDFTYSERRDFLISSCAKRE